MLLPFTLAHNVVGLHILVFSNGALPKLSFAALPKLSLVHFKCTFGAVPKLSVVHKMSFGTVHFQSCPWCPPKVVIRALPKLFWRTSKVVFAALPKLSLLLFQSCLCCTSKVVFGALPKLSSYNTTQICCHRASCKP